ncbi:MAG TPA: hypothetical protein ENH99_01910 [Candidatus Pacearchaeota archaeon]|nr:hypothetical protein [Candidatus Pacearchaeota archaeon]
MELRDLLKYSLIISLVLPAGLGAGSALNWIGRQRFEARAERAFDIVIPCIDRDGNGADNDELDDLYRRYREAGGYLGDTIIVSDTTYEFRIGGDNLDSLLEFCENER